MPTNYYAVLLISIENVERFNILTHRNNKFIYKKILIMSIISLIETGAQWFITKKIILGMEGKRI